MIKDARYYAMYEFAFEVIEKINGIGQPHEDIIEKLIEKHRKIIYYPLLERVREGKRYSEYKKEDKNRRFNELIGKKNEKYY